MSEKRRKRREERIKRREEMNKKVEVIGEVMELAADALCVAFQPEVFPKVVDALITITSPYREAQRAAERHLADKDYVDETILHNKENAIRWLKRLDGFCGLSHDVLEGIGNFLCLTDFTIPLPNGVMIVSQTAGTVCIAVSYVMGMIQKWTKRKADEEERKLNQMS